MVVVLVTTSSIQEAKKIAKTLVEEKKAACVNIIPNLISIYRWEGDIQEDEEVLLIIKTTSLEKVKERIKKLHSYQVPEILAFEVKDGEQSYLEWVKESVE